MLALFVDNDRLWLRYGNGPHLPGPIPNAPMAGDAVRPLPGKIVRFAEDWTISPTIVNHLGYGYNRLQTGWMGSSYLSGKDWASLLGLENVGSAAFPEITWQGFDATLGSGLYPQLGGGWVEDSPNGSNILTDDLTWIRRGHSFRFGFEHRRYYDNRKSIETTGSYEFSNENTALPGYRRDKGFTYASFLLGKVRSSSLYVPLVATGIRSRVTSFYVQDDWKARRNLTVNFGLRWDIPTALTEVRQRQSGLDPTMPNPGADGYPGAMVMLGNCEGCSGKGRFADPYYKQFAPRVGFAWSPLRSPRTVVRGGYGLFYGRLRAAVAARPHYQNGVSIQTRTFTALMF